MKLLAIILAVLSSATLLMFGYGFAPWPGNIVGDSEILGFPLWIICALLGGALAIDSVFRVREWRARKGR